MLRYIHYKTFQCNQLKIMMNIYVIILVGIFNIRKHIKHTQIITFWSGLYETSKDTYR
jgi:hypothetical protein